MTDDVGRDLAALAVRVERLEHTQLRREQERGSLSESDTWPEVYGLTTVELTERYRKQGPQEEM